MTYSGNEQTSWLLFVKYLDGLEQDKDMEAELEGKTWAAPKTADGELDHNKALTGDDLRAFVDRKLPLPRTVSNRRRAQPDLQ